MKRYAMIQIDAEVHQMLKEYCKERGYSFQSLEKEEEDVNNIFNEILEISNKIKGEIR
jgi:hypothetical protein